MRLDPTKTAAPPVLETQESAPVTNGRLPRSNVLMHWSNNALPALALGAELEAVVLEELTDGRLLLKIGGNLIEADSPGGINPGQLLHLRVEQLQPQVVLQITELEPTLEASAARLLRQHLPAHADSGELLEQLQTLLTAQLEAPGDGAPGMASVKKLHDAIGLLLGDRAPISAEGVHALLQNGGLHYEAKLARAVQEEAPGDGAPGMASVKKLHDAIGLLLGDRALTSAVRVQALLQNGGLQHEAKLARVVQKEAPNLRELVDRDLKGLLLSALEESKSTPLGTAIVQTIHAQLNNLETQQAVNLLAQLNDGGLQLQIPFFNGASFATAALSVERDGKGSPGRAQGQGGYNLLFLLDLENFGRTRIDAHVAERSLRVIFYVDRDSSVVLAKEGLAEFREILLGLGYQEVLLAARPLKEIPEEKRQTFDALAVGAPASIHLLDTKA